MCGDDDTDTTEEEPAVKEADDAVEAEAVEDEDEVADDAVEDEDEADDTDE